MLDNTLCTVSDEAVLDSVQEEHRFDVWLCSEVRLLPCMHDVSSDIADGAERIALHGSVISQPQLGCTVPKVPRARLSSVAVFGARFGFSMRLA